MKVREALTAALPRLDEEKYDELMDVVEDVILHESLVSFSRVFRGGCKSGGASTIYFSF